MGMPTLVPSYTAEEVRNFPDDRLRYEVICGELFVSPAPGTRHQRVVVELLGLLKHYVEQHRLGEVLVGPFEVEFAEDTAVQPDLLVLFTDRADQLTDKRLVGAPSIVVEVISYSSKRTDRLQKRELYLAEGVEEYWIVDPELRCLERWRPGAQEPEVLTDLLIWRPRSGVPPLEVNLVELFRKVWKRVVTA